MKILLIIVLCANLICSSVTVTAQSNGDKEQAQIARKIEKLYVKRAKLCESYHNDSIRNCRAKEKIKELEGEGDFSSLTYKSTVKKSKKYQNSIDETIEEIRLIDIEISEFKHILSPTKSIEANGEHEERAEQTNQSVPQNTEKAESADQPDKHNEAQSKTKKKQKSVDKSSTVSGNNSVDDENVNQKAKHDKKDDGGTMLATVIVAIIVFVYLAFDFRRKHRCPECGKWFVMNSMGDVRVWDHDSNGKITRRGARKKYKCSNCGHVTEFVQWFNK